MSRFVGIGNEVLLHICVRGCVYTTFRTRKKYTHILLLEQVHDGLVKKDHHHHPRGLVSGFLSLYVYIYIYVYVYICMCTCIYVRMYVCMYVRTHTDSLSLAHTQTHTGHVIQHDENTVRKLWRRWQVQFLNLKFMFANICLKFKKAEPVI